MDGKKFNLSPVSAKDFELAPVGPEAFLPENLGGVQPEDINIPSLSASVSANIEPQQPDKRAGFWGNLNKKFGATIYDMAKGVTELPQWQEATQNTYVKGLAKAYLNRQVKKGKVDADEAEAWKNNMDEWLPKMGFIYPVQPGEETLGEKIAESGVNQWLGKTAEQLRAEGNRYDKSVTGYLKNKEWGKAFGAEITAVIESAPYTIAAAFGGPMGATGLGAVVGAQKYDEVKDREDMSDAMKLVDASSTAFWESFFEYIGTKQMVDWLKRSYATTAKDKVEDAVKGAATNFLGKAYKKLGVWFAPIHEGTSEFATTVAQNLTAKYTGEDPNRNPWDGSIESFLIGAGMGTMAAVAEQGMEQIPKYYQKKILGEPTPQEIGPLTVPDAEQKINQYGEQLKFGRTPLTEDPDPMIEFGMNKMDGRIFYLTNVKTINDNPDDNVYTAYDADALKETEFDFTKVKQEFIKSSDVSERKQVPYSEWFQNEMNEYLATMDQLNQMGQDVQAQTEAPVQEGQTINLEGKEFNVTSVTADGISLNEIDKDGNITGETLNITPDQYGQVFNLPQTAGIQEEANQPQNALQAPIDEGIQQQAPAQPQAPQLPVNKKGEIEYEQITDPGMYAQGLQQEFGEEAGNVLAELITEQTTALDKARKSANAIERARKVKAINAEIAKLTQVKNIITPVVVSPVSEIEPVKQEAAALEQTEPVQTKIKEEPENAEEIREGNQPVAPEGTPPLVGGEGEGRNIRYDEQGRLVEQPEQAEAPEVKAEKVEVPAEVKPETKEINEETVQKPAGQPATEQEKPEEPTVVEKTGEETKEHPAETAGIIKFFPNSALKGKKLTIKTTNAETGEMENVTINAFVLQKQLRKRKLVLEKLKNCVG